MKSNMYEFIKETINPLSGDCSHSCKYCYVNVLKKRFKAIKDKYSGEIRLDENVLKKRLKKDILYFVCSCNDLFADNVPLEYIIKILDWIGDDKILLQTKNPERLLKYIPMIKDLNPNAIVCITLETWKKELIQEYSNAPVVRLYYIRQIAQRIPTQITIEPIMNIGNKDDIKDFAEELIEINLQQINIGANTNMSISLPEPTKEELEYFITLLKEYVVNVHLKSNLDRLLK